MDDSKISFLKPHKFYGEFEFAGCKNKYSGHLVYTPQKKLYLELIGNNEQENIFTHKIKIFSSNEIHKTKEIYGRVCCEETGNFYNVFLFNSQATWPLSLFPATTKIFFNAVLFTNPDVKTKNLKSIEFQYSGLEKFFCPDLYNGHIPFKRKQEPIKFGRLKNILFKEKCNGSHLGEDFFKNNITPTHSIEDREFNKICSELNRVIAPYRDKLFFNKEIYRSILLSYPVKKIEDVIPLNNLLRNLFMCLSNNFTINTEFVTLNYDNRDQSFLLFFDTITETKQTWQYPHIPFWMGTFNDDDWKTIFKNLFAKKKLLENLFFILSNNARGEYLTPYSLVRSIDGLKAIGKLTLKSKQHYSNAIDIYIKDLEKKEQNSFNSFLNKSLKYLHLSPKEQTQPDLRGKKISKLRALVEHFHDYLNVDINLETLADLVHTFDFIIQDYIFKELGIDPDKRLEYKRRILYLSNILPFSKSRKVVRKKAIQCKNNP